MRKGRPYIRLEGDKERAEGMLRRAHAELDRTKVLAKRMGVDDYQRIIKMDEDSYIIIKLVRGGIEIVNIFASPHVPTKVTRKEVIKEEAKVSISRSIYSGFVYEGWIPEILDGEGNPTFPHLFEFNPTVWCRKTNPNDFDPDLDYQNVSRLVIEKSVETPPQRLDWYANHLGFPPVNAKVSQYNSVRPCAYTGLMAKAVSTILGYGNFNLTSNIQYGSFVKDLRDGAYLTSVEVNGFQVLYDNRFTRSHHITKASNDKLWLVETSLINGVVAMPLRYLNEAQFESSPEKDWPVSEVIRELGGLPSGESFPSSRQGILDGIIDGTIIELMTPQAYGIALTDDWLELGETYCWAMNEDGTEGRLTAFKFHNDDVNFKDIGYFQLTINIVNTVGSASINLLQGPTLVVSGFKQEIDQPQLNLAPPVLSYISPGSGFFGRGVALDLLLNIYQQETDSFTSLGISTTIAKWLEIVDDVPDETECVVWVGYINGAWEEIKFYTKKFNDLEDTYYTNSQPRADFDPQYASFNIGIQIPKTGSTSIGKRHWNPNELPIIHYAHVRATSQTDYDRNRFTRTFKELRWNSINSLEISAPNTTFSNGSGIAGFGASQLLIDVPYTHAPNPVAGNHVFSLYQLFYIEFQVSSFWCVDFPELNTRFTIPPHNRSAYMYFEEEYMPRRFGPIASASGNGGIRSPTKDGLVSYYSNNKIDTGWGTWKTSFWISGDKANAVREEIALNESAHLIFPGFVYDPSPMPYRALKHSNPSNFFMFPPDDIDGVIDPQNSYWGHLPMEWPQLFIRTQEQSPGGRPTSILTWSNNIDPQYNHPHDVFTGDIGQCENWHDRVNHFTHVNGTKLFSSWNESNIWTDGFSQVSKSSPHPGIGVGFGGPGLLWHDIGASVSSIEFINCQKVNFLSDTPLPITLPTPSRSIFGQPSVTVSEDVEIDAAHWNVLETNHYNDWNPFIKIRSFFLCDTFPKINFEERDIEGTDDASFIVPPNLVNYNWSTNDTLDLLDDSDIELWRNHMTVHGIFIQHAVIGKPAILYSNLDAFNIKGVGFFDIISQGVHPIVADTGGDDERLKLTTFVGVNSE